MGWYLHEVYSQFIELPTKYSLAVCATCWVKKTNKFTDEELEKEPRIFDIVYAKKSKYFITQEKFEKEHKGHVLAYVKIYNRWCEWKPQVYCKEHGEWTEVYSCTHGTQKTSRRRTWDPCQHCFLLQDWSHSVCDCPLETILQNPGPRFCK